MYNAHLILVCLFKLLYIYHYIFHTVPTITKSILLDDDQDTHTNTHAKRVREESITIMQTNCHISRSKFAYGILNIRKISLRTQSASVSAFVCVFVSNLQNLYTVLFTISEMMFSSNAFARLLLYYFIWNSVGWVMLVCSCGWHKCF